MTPRVRNCVHPINIFYVDYIIICSTTIPSDANTTKKIYPSGNLLDEFISIYYDYNNDTFGIFSEQYTASSIGNIYHPYIII